MNKSTTFQQYKYQAKRARHFGYNDTEIIKELISEKINIRNVLVTKLVSLSGNKSPYPAREATRLASESVLAIDRVISELQAKEIEA